MAHLYTYNSLVGLRAGIAMTISAPLPNNPTRTAPPHLRVDGAGFIDVNTRWQNAQFVSGRLLHASLTKIEPANSRAFQVFDAPRSDDDFVSLIFIDTSVPPGTKRRAEADINAWLDIRGEGFTAIMADTNTGAALLRCGSNATIELFQFDGAVRQLRIVNSKVSTVPLSQKQMAQLRVEQFKEQIAHFNMLLERDVRRTHGILSSALRLVQVVKDAGALDVFADFLVEHQAVMTDNLRKQVRYALLDAGHPAASTFLDGFEAVNVVNISSPDAAAKRAAADKKRRDRDADNRRRTEDAKNRANKGEGDITKQSHGRGGSKKARGGKKKAA